MRCDFAVGADGLKSRVRRALLGDGAPRRRPEQRPGKAEESTGECGRLEPNKWSREVAIGINWKGIDFSCLNSVALKNEVVALSFCQCLVPLHLGRLGRFIAAFLAQYRQRFSGPTAQACQHLPSHQFDGVSQESASLNALVFGVPRPTEVHRSTPRPDPHHSPTLPTPASRALHE